MTRNDHWHLPPSPLLASVAGTALAVLAVLVAAAIAMRAALGLSAGYPLKAAALFAAIALLAVGHVDGYHPFARFGAANQVTAVRAALVVLVACLIGESGTWTTAAAAVCLSLAATILDGLDGWLSRSSGMASAFGARFDMETDALLIQALALLAWRYGKAGPWVLASGLMRYVFVAAGWLWDWIRQPLFPSFRRKLICVVQVGGLILTVAPVITLPASSMIAALSLAALAYSFFVDTAWLWRHAP